MSTRANIIIKDDYSSLIFYRHSDGYPEGAMPTLKIFLDLVKSGKIRNNPEQAAGWLIIIGNREYDSIFGWDGEKHEIKSFDVKDWKVGAYEPTDDIHGDIEFLYEIDLDKKTIECWHHDGDTKQEKVDIAEYLM